MGSTENPKSTSRIGAGSDTARSAGSDDADPSNSLPGRGRRGSDAPAGQKRASRKSIIHSSECWQQMQGEISNSGTNGEQTDAHTSACEQTADGVMQAPETAPEPGLGSCQELPKPSLLGSKRSHSSGNRSDESESGTEQSHHDQRQRRRGGSA